MGVVADVRFAAHSSHCVFVFSLVVCARRHYSRKPALESLRDISSGKRRSRVFGRAFCAPKVDCIDTGLLPSVAKWSQRNGSLSALLAIFGGFRATYLGTDRCDPTNVHATSWIRKHAATGDPLNATNQYKYVRACRPLSIFDFHVSCVKSHHANNSTY